MKPDSKNIFISTLAVLVAAVVLLTAVPAIRSSAQAGAAAQTAWKTAKIIVDAGHGGSFKT